MSFVSPAFLACLPIVLLISAWLRRRPGGQNLFLLAFSLFFYGYWDWRFLGLLLVTIVADFVLAQRIAAAKTPRARKAWLAACLACGLGLLGAFKYYDFLAASLGGAFPWLGLAQLGWVLPVGISFYTFQSLSYVIDVYRGAAPCRSVVDYALYVSFFPQLEAGPIERAARLLPQLGRPKFPGLSQVREGGYLLLYGMFQKVAVGDAAGSVADIALHHAARGWVTVGAGLLAFSVQIYGDFAGYSNIARGCAKLLGVELMVNFRTPYFSASVTEFWRRWHISLSTFLRDYLYLPLGGNRLGRARATANLMVVMLLGGLWHGADWRFVVWGGLHGAYLVLHKVLLRGRAPGRPTAMKSLAVFALVTLTWAFFRAPGVGEAWNDLRMLLTLQEGSWSPAMLMRLAVICAFAFPLDWLSWRRDTDLAPLCWPWWLRGPLYAFLVWSVYGGIGGRHPFLYFQF